MWRRVDIVWTDVSEERVASIFRAAHETSGFYSTQFFCWINI
jgi:hypothetical protein